MKLNIILLLFIFTSNIFGQEKINGISFVASNREISVKAINPVIELNANWVALMPYAFIKTETDTAIVFNSKQQWIGERKEGIEHTAKAFKSKKFKIMLKPQTWIARGGLTGHLKMKNELEWKALENNYEKYILFYTKIAETSNSDIFCIGTELNCFVSERPIFWDNLILKIRKIYKGKITYAENWDSYKNVPFLSKLDFIGIDAYFPLSNEKTPTLRSLELAWNPLKIEIKKFSEKHNIKILFTEFGYQSKDFAATEPWDHSKNSAVNLVAQQNALAVILANFWKEKWFAGGFLWKWYDNHEQVGGLYDTDYTVQNKPSELILAKFYKNN